MFISNLQAVTVKEALSTKARQLRRSLSTPNVHNVSSPTRQGLPPKWHISGFGVEPQVRVYRWEQDLGR